jgi:hypothetical protein
MCALFVGFQHAFLAGLWDPALQISVHATKEKHPF